ncbi:MAG TPA: hypothetical protein VL049_06060 [Candidatus Dormibacteraeota bacterium]|nr:hypothetical protein [Candidatus Dormibacteraeota bacterium]
MTGVEGALGGDERGAAQRLADDAGRLAAAVELEVGEEDQLHDLDQVARQPAPAHVAADEIARLQRRQLGEIAVGEEVLRHLQPVPVPLAGAEVGDLAPQQLAQRLDPVGVERRHRGADVGRAVVTPAQAGEGRQRARERAGAAAHGVVRLGRAVDADGDDQLEIGPALAHQIGDLDRALPEPAVGLEVEHAQRRRGVEHRREQLDRVAAQERLAAGDVEPQQSRHLRQHPADLVRGDLVRRLGLPRAAHLAAQIAAAGDVHHQARRRRGAPEPRLGQAGDHAGAPTQPSHLGHCGLHVRESGLRTLSKVLCRFANGNSAGARART